MSGCRSRWLYNETSRKRAISFVPYLCFMVCVCGGGGGHFHEATRKTPSQMARFISPNPNPVTISPYPFTSHGSMWPCVYVHTR